MRQTITVEGMTCGHCEETVEGALSDVTDATADREAEQASVDGDGTVTASVQVVTLDTRHPPEPFQEKYV